MFHKNLTKAITFVKLVIFNLKKYKYLNSVLQLYELERETLSTSQ